MPEFKGLNLCNAERLVLPFQDVRVGVPRWAGKPIIPSSDLFSCRQSETQGSAQRITQSCHSGNQVVIQFGGIFFLSSFKQTAILYCD